MKVKKTERGWAGHFIASSNCLFRRNTLLEYNDKKIVISTVGNYVIKNPFTGKKYTEYVGLNRYYETMAFYALKGDKYNDADVSREIRFESKWALKELDDIKANNMHEKVVEEITEKLLNNAIKEIIEED